ALSGDLVEQAGVLEGDRRLVGEALHKADDGRRKFTRSAPMQHKGAERTLTAEQRNNETCSQARLDRGIAQGIAWTLENIRHLQRLPLGNGLAEACLSTCYVKLAKVGNGLFV